MTKKVAIIHPWLPRYRSEFFTELIATAKRANIEITIFAGAPPREWRLRADSIDGSNHHVLPTRFLGLGRRDLILKSLAPVRNAGPFDLIVVEQAVRNLETYLLLFGRDSTPIAFWGHGRTYTKEVGKAQEALKQWLTRRSDWFFAYTNGGREAVARAGFPANRITVVQNAIDTRGLRRQVDSVSDEDIAAFRDRHQLTEYTALFIGALDASKRLPFLFEAAGSAYERNSAFRLLVAGAGEDEGWIRRIAPGTPWLRFAGRLVGKSKATAMAASSVLAMPGRVGLVAVDSFAGRLPIVTTRWPWHAPEVEYLENGRNALFTEDNPISYAEGLTTVMGDQDFRQRLAEECRKDGLFYTTEAMTSNFLEGLSLALDTCRHSSTEQR